MVADLCVAARPVRRRRPPLRRRPARRGRRAAAAELLVAADERGRIHGTVTFVPDGGPLGEIADPARRSSACSRSTPRRAAARLGTALLAHVLDASRARGRNGIVCSSLPTMRAAHRIYERLGFTREPGARLVARARRSTCCFAIALD